MASRAVSLSPTLEHGDSHFDLGDLHLRAFNSVPDHHEVIDLLGLVLVCEGDALSRDAIREGGLYVVESQTPVGGMNWETYDRLNREFGTEQPRVRIKATRRVVCVLRSKTDPNLWWQVQQSGFRDGPYEEWALAHNMVGKVVGVYQPHDASKLRPTAPNVYRPS